MEFPIELEGFPTHGSVFYESREVALAKSTWCLIVSMKERMGDGVYDDSWWGEDYARVEKECKKVLGIE